MVMMMTMTMMVLHGYDDDDEDDGIIWLWYDDEDRGSDNSGRNKSQRTKSVFRPAHHYHTMPFLCHIFEMIFIS